MIVPQTRNSSIDITAQNTKKIQCSFWPGIHSGRISIQESPALIQYVDFSFVSLLR